MEVLFVANKKDIFVLADRMYAYIQSLDEDNPKRILGEKVYEVLNSGVFTKRVYADKYIKYRRYKDDIITAKLGISSVNLRKIKYDVRSDAYALLGENIFDIIYSDDLEIVKDRLANFDTSVDLRKSDELFPNEIVDSIRLLTTEEKDYEVTDCLPEIGFLYWLYSDRLKDIILDLDADRLKYILKVLDGERLGADRLEVLRLLKKDDILSMKLSNKARKSFTFPPKREEE